MIEEEVEEGTEVAEETTLTDVMVEIETFPGKSTISIGVYPLYMKNLDLIEEMVVSKRDEDSMIVMIESHLEGEGEKREAAEEEEKTEGHQEKEEVGTTAVIVMRVRGENSTHGVVGEMIREIDEEVVEVATTAEEMIKSQLLAQIWIKN